ncbi:hypothetical protein ND991_23200, partial [Gordonia sputi]|uniref:hypothetical protein n=1 Tax=Gordonia sputi TaxID=36823 RepID=UPI0020433B55
HEHDRVLGGLSEQSRPKLGSTPNGAKIAGSVKLRGSHNLSNGIGFSAADTTDVPSTPVAGTDGATDIGVPDVDDPHPDNPTRTHTATTQPTSLLT